MSIRDGVWVGQEGTALSPQPIDQARDNAYALRRRLRTVPGLERVEVEYGVALPNTRTMEGDLPPDVVGAQVLMAPDLTEANAAIEELALARRHSQAIGREQMEGIVNNLCPDVELRVGSGGSGQRHPPASRRSCATPRSRCSSPSPRTGGSWCEAVPARARPGSPSPGPNRPGTTAIGCCSPASTTRWPMCCAASCPPSTTTISSSGPFLRLALTLPGMPPLAVPADADATWWDTVATGHLHKWWPLIGVAFDTIVVDEAQDFSPAWLAQLQALLDPDGRRRTLIVADEGQGIYERGFRFPDPDDGWVRAELVSNCRNAAPIARILRRKLGGAPAPSMSPEGLGVTWRAADDLDSMVAQVDAELERLDDEGRERSGICVATFHTAVRDRLRSELDLCCWEDARQRSGGVRDRPPPQGPRVRHRHPRQPRRRGRSRRPLRRRQPSRQRAHRRRP